MLIIMKCSYCDKPAQAECTCNLPYLCNTHFSSHFLSAGNHPFNSLSIDLGTLRLKNLRSIVKEHLQIINKAKNYIVSNTVLLITTIESLYTEAMERLGTLSKVYIELLKQDKFFESQKPFIEKIETMDLNVQTLLIDDIRTHVEKFYAHESVTYKERLENRRIQFLEKHNGGFYSGAITKDGKTLVTGGSDATIRVWDLALKKQRFVLHGHNSSVFCLALTGDSQNIISGSFDASVRIWNIQEQKQVAVLKEHKGAVYSICFENGQSLIISADFNRELIIWDYASYNILKKIILPAIAFSLITMKTQFKLIAGCKPDIYFYDLKTWNKIETLRGYNGTVLTISLTNDEKKMVSGSGDESIIIWDLVKSEKISQIKANCGCIRSLAITSDSQLIVTGSDDYSVRTWSIQTGKQVSQFKKHNLYVYKILLGNNSILSLSEDAALGELDIRTNTFQLNWLLKPFKSGFETFSADSSLIGYGSNSEVRIWDLEKEENILFGHEKIVQFVEISRDCRFAISGSLGSGANLIYWDLERNSKITELRGHKASVFCVSFSKDCLSAASGSGDKTVRVWNLRECKQEIEFKGHTGNIYSIKFIDNKKLLVSAGVDKTVRVWSISDRTQYACFTGHLFTIWKVLVTEDERFVLSGCVLEGIRVWNIEEKQQELSFSFEEEALSWLKENRIPFDSVKRFLKS